MSRQSTPKKEENQPTSGQFTPVILPESPAASTPKRNLTGLPRVARDLAADVYNDIQRWNGIHINGAFIVKDIAKIKSDTFRMTQYPNNLENLCVNLMQVVDTLKELSLSLKQSSNRMNKLVSLHKNKIPLFISWPTSQLAEVVEFICGAYEMEYQVKRTVCETIAHSSSKEEAMFQATAWIVQPYIDKHVNIKLEALVTETGHRKT